MAYIFGMIRERGGDSVVENAVNLLRRKRVAITRNDPKIAYDALDLPWPQINQNEMLYMVGHADSQGFEDGNDPRDLCREKPGLEDLIKGCGEIALYACSAGDIPILENGFQANNCAEVWLEFAQKPIYAAVGIVGVGQDDFDVKYNHNAYTIGTDHGWFKYSLMNGSKAKQGSNPITRIVT